RLLYLVFYLSDHHPDPHSFPTRRSSDLHEQQLHARPNQWRKQATVRRRPEDITMEELPPAHVLQGLFLRNITIPLNIRLLIQDRSEEHTSELQSRFDLVCRLLLEKKKEK